MQNPSPSASSAPKAPMAVAHVRTEPAVVFHELEAHLRKVSGLASAFASAFGSGSWAAYAGLWHDLGKYRDGFQRYIRQCASTDKNID